MKRADLEHIPRASKGVTGESEFVVIGSQAILGPHPDAPRELRESMEADLYPRLRPELAEMIEGSLGRYSQFDQTFGYFADGVSPSTATVPQGWDQRLIPLCNENTAGATGCERSLIRAVPRQGLFGCSNSKARIAGSMLPA